MSFELLRERKPTASVVVMILVIVLALLLAGLAVLFAWLLLTGRGSDYLMGSILALEFLLAGLLLVCYAKGFVVFREVAEDREERLLW